MTDKPQSWEKMSDVELFDATMAVMDEAIDTAISAKPQLCPGCDSPMYAVDEDGCCASCGADVYFDEDGNPRSGTEPNELVAIKRFELGDMIARIDRLAERVERMTAAVGGQVTGPTFGSAWPGEKLASRTAQHEIAIELARALGRDDGDASKLPELLEAVGDFVTEVRELREKSSIAREAEREVAMELGRALGKSNAIFLWKDMLDTVGKLVEIRDAVVGGAQVPDGVYLNDFALERAGQLHQAAAAGKFASEQAAKAPETLANVTSKMRTSLAVVLGVENDLTWGKYLDRVRDLVESRETSPIRSMDGMRWELADALGEPSAAKWSELIQLASQAKGSAADAETRRAELAVTLGVSATWGEVTEAAAEIKAENGRLFDGLFNLTTVMEHQVAESLGIEGPTTWANTLDMASKMANGIAALTAEHHRRKVAVAAALGLDEVSSWHEIIERAEEKPKTDGREAEELRSAFEALADELLDSENMDADAKIEAVLDRVNARDSLEFVTSEDWRREFAEAFALPHTTPWDELLDLIRDGSSGHAPDLADALGCDDATEWPQLLKFVRGLREDNDRLYKRRELEHEQLGETLGMGTMQSWADMLAAVARHVSDSRSLDRILAAIQEGVIGRKAGGQ